MLILRLIHEFMINSMVNLVVGLMVFGSFNA